MKKYLFIILWMLLSLQPSLMGQERRRFSVIGLGDSITEGGVAFGSYLFPLWEKLFAAGYEFDFIGPRENDSRIGKLRHGGYSGHTVEFLAEQIDSLYRLYPADIVLLHAGHNHFVEEKPIPSMMDAYRRIVHQILSLNPDAHIFVAQVIPSGKLPKYAYIPELNNSIANWVDSLSSPQVHLVDQASGFDWREMTIEDHVHPNQAGAERMAQVWMDALQEVFPPAISFSPEVLPYKELPDGGTLSLHLFRPKGVEPDALLPVVVFFFGGGWRLGTPLQFYRECAYYASQGIVAVSVDYRIYHTHGTTPLESFEDACDALCWLRTHACEFQIDPDRIAAAGGSAGGQLAAALGTVGSTDSHSAPYAPNLLLLYYPAVDLGPEGYNSAGEKGLYLNISPLHHLCRTTPPTLFLVGTKDPVVPVRIATLYRDKMVANGGECELHLFEGIGHPLFLYREPLTEIFYDIRRLTDSFLRRHGYLTR